MIKRIAVVDRELCKQKKCGYQCSKVCPKNRAGENCIVVDKETNFPVVDEGICIGCGLCIKACEKAGFKALTVINLPTPLEESPIHRFGPSGFCLFRLPFPAINQIVGLIGPNGTGKTTALRVLSGELSPNLGEFGKEVDFSMLIKIFRGTELQAYLEKLMDKQVKTSIKPQRVDKIPALYKGVVSKLLKKVDERGILNDLLKTLDLEGIMESKIDEISGGELQRMAIAACIAKDADIYYLDEPTSFLDVFQRLTIAKVIRDSCRDRAVMIVDHDLATLDFLADQVHIFYGVPGAYGVVSKPYGVRVGINTFLDGFIKEDNVRIRPEPITFGMRFIERKEGKRMVWFENLRKKFDKFALEIKRGEIYNEDVLAILGANALGKTTFARILAEEVKPDSGWINEKIKISYKQQYPQPKFRGTVKGLLKKITARFETDDYKTEIVRPLELEKVLDREVKELSGGELQRVAIAASLSQTADLYLFDEPCAFMDIEQRLRFAKMLRKFVEVKEVSAVVIDHDLLFLSQIADRAMVFLGIPGKRGVVEDVTYVKDAFNAFLKEVGISFRADVSTGRPRANKPESKMDREQKEKGEYFYIP